MADFVVVEVAKSVKGLPHDQSGLALSKVLVLSDEEKKFPAFTKSKKIKNLILLCDEKADPFCFPSFMELNDIRVILKRIRSNYCTSCIRIVISFLNDS